MNLRSAAKKVLPQSVANQIRVAAYRWTLRRFQPYQVRRTWAGYQFDLWISDPTSESWYDRDSPEVPTEMSFLARHRLRAGATVFDCGAHQAVIAMVMGRLVGASGKVIAVEASPHNYETAVRNCSLNAADNVTVVHAAVSDNLEPVEFNRRGNGQVDDGTGAWGKIAVPSVSVDELARRHGPPRRSVRRCRRIRIESAARRNRNALTLSPGLLLRDARWMRSGKIRRLGESNNRRARRAWLSALDEQSGSRQLRSIRRRFRRRCVTIFPDRDRRRILIRDRTPKTNFGNSK